MKTQFTNSDNLPIEQARRLPDEDWFTPERIERQQELQHIQTTASNHDTLVVADIDADGLGCVAVTQTALNDDVGFIPAGPHGPVLDLAEAFTEIADHVQSNTTILVCDISPNEDDWDALEPTVNTLSSNAGDLVWCDHHNYTREILSGLERVTTDLRIGNSETQCATDMVYEYLTDTVNPTWPDHITDLVSVTRDRDCWILEDARNEDIADFAEIASYDRYINVVIEHGPDLTSDVHTELTSYRSKKKALIGLAVENTTIHELDVGQNDDYDTETFRLATVYGRCPSSDTAEAIRTEHNAHAVVMVKPSGAGSLRGSNTFTDCGVIASQFGGGGHDQAAGCFPAGVVFASLLDFAAHWQSNGQLIEQLFVMAFADLLNTRLPGMN